MKTTTTISLLLIGLMPLPAAADPQGVSTKDWIPLENRATPYRITQGEGEGNRILGTFSSTDAAGNQWRMVIGERRATHLQRGPGGRLAITQQVLLDDRMRCVFDPPMTLLPARLTENEPIEERGTVTIYDTESGDETASGSYTQKIELLNRVNVQTPAGEITGYRVYVTQGIDASLADLRVTMDIVFKPGHGRVYQHLVKHTEKLGFLENTTVEEIRLAPE